MRTPGLVTPLTLGTITFRNRLWIAPMCQYSVLAGDGVPTDWHLMHLGRLAAGGAGLVIAESTGVSPEGRISPRDTGLWNDDQVAAWRRITDFVRERGAVPGVQLNHAGRKASTWAPWGSDGRSGTVPVEEGGWEPLGASAIAFDGYATPRPLDAGGLDTVVADFASAAVRAQAAGFEVVEIHAAHGYLLHQFLSPLSNQRTDDYGGSLENRARLLLRVLDAVRESAPDLLVFVRFSATDWMPGGLDQDEVATVAGWAEHHGAQFFDVSTGGNAAAQIPVGPGYQVRFAQHVRAAVGVPVGAVGLITDAAQAEQVIASGQADVVLIAREALRNPSAPINWAHHLGAADAVPWAPQYERAQLR